MLGLKDYLTVALSCILLCVIFMLFNPKAYSVSDDDALTQTGGGAAAAGAAPVITLAPPQTPDGEKAVAVIGGDGETLETVEHTLAMLHLNYERIDSFNGLGRHSLAIVCKNEPGDIDALKSYLANGGNVIFAALPDNPDADLLELLGAERYEAGRSYESVTLHDGIFINGMYHAESYPMAAAYAELTGRCIVLARAFEQRINEADINWRALGSDTTPAIWRTYYEGGALYAVNGPFIRYASGAGVLTGLISLSYGDFIYPVIGTKTVQLDYFPYLQTESNNLTRSSMEYIRDVLWPSLLSIARSSDTALSCYSDAAFLESGEAGEILNYLRGELGRLKRSELGLIAGDAEKGLAAFTQHLPQYTVRSLTGVPSYLPPGVTSVTGSRGFGQAGEQAVTLPVTNVSKGGGDADFERESALSAFGYILFGINAKQLFEETDGVTARLVEVAKQTTAAFNGTGFLEPAPVRNAAERTKDLANTRISAEANDSGIRVTMSGNSAELKFYLRTGREADVRRSANCVIEAVDDGVYLVTSAGPEFTVQWK
jgi:hypothetical protein